MASKHFKQWFLDTLRKKQAVITHTNRNNDHITMEIAEASVKNDVSSDVIVVVDKLKNKNVTIGWEDIVSWRFR